MRGKKELKTKNHPKDGKKATSGTGGNPRSSKELLETAEVVSLIATLAHQTEQRRVR